MVIVIVIAIVITICLTLKKRNNENYRKQVLQTMISHNNFFPDYYQIMSQNSGAIALDVSQRILCIIDGNGRPYYLNKLNIISTEILIDKEKYEQKDFIRTWGKYFILKSIGDESTAEVSVHTSRKKEIIKIKTLKLKIGTASLNTPNLYLLFLKNGTVKHKRQIINDVHDWVTRIESIQNS